MKKTLRMGKWIEDVVDKDSICDFYLCESFKDIVKYSEVVRKGFNMNPLKSIFYFFTSFYNGYQNYIIKQNNEIIGCFSLYFDTYIDEETDVGKSFVVLYDLCILSEYQGNGLGKLYLYSIVKKVKNDFCDFIELEVDKKNTRAISLYKSLDFFDIKD